MEKHALKYLTDDKLMTKQGDEVNSSPRFILWKFIRLRANSLDIVSGIVVIVFETGLHILMPHDLRENFEVSAAAPHVGIKGMAAGIRRKYGGVLFVRDCLDTQLCKRWVKLTFAPVV